VLLVKICNHGIILFKVLLIKRLWPKEFWSSLFLFHPHCFSAGLALLLKLPSYLQRQMPLLKGTEVSCNNFKLV
jgi:hypothetical protein